MLLLFGILVIAAPCIIVAVYMGVAGGKQGTMKTIYVYFGITLASGRVAVYFLEADAWQFTCL